MSPPGGPIYLDFITPDEVFDKGPAAVKDWQEAKRAEWNHGPSSQMKGDQP
jgi:hypothetical protein